MSELRAAIARNEFDGLATRAITRLRDHEYAYNNEKFPRLVNTPALKGECPDRPRSLAEALLWKIGKWNAYRNFVNFHARDLELPQNAQSAVFEAFALHLKDPNSNPIFDQHTLRALWAILQFSAGEAENCRGFLVDGDGKWRTVGASAYSIACYKLFRNQVRDLETSGLGALDTIDKLLMPLGQALKECISPRDPLFSEVTPANSTAQE